MLIPSPTEIAEREARRLALVLREVGGEGAPVGGGWMACDLPGSWAHYAAGLGVGRPVDDASLDALVAYYRARNRTPRIQVTPYQHPTLRSGLKERGFAPYSRESVLVRGLDSLPQVLSAPGLSFRRLDPSNDRDVEAFRDAQMTGFFEDEPPPAGMLPITERVARASRCLLWLLELEGQVVGSGGLEVFEEVGVLMAGCVHPAARRRGLHSAFIRFRLEQAARAGLRYVTIGSLLDEPTERNALRAGFAVSFEQIRLEQVGEHSG